MSWTALGTVTSTGIGNLTPISTARISCEAILFQALSNPTKTNTGRIFVFDSKGVRLATLAPPSANSIPSLSITVPNAPGALNCADFSISAEASGDGVDVSYARP